MRSLDNPIVSQRKFVFKHAQNAQIQIHPAHAQSVIRTFALHRYLLLFIMFFFFFSGE